MVKVIVKLLRAGYVARLIRVLAKSRFTLDTRFGYNGRAGVDIANLNNETELSNDSGNADAKIREFGKAIWGKTHTWVQNTRTHCILRSRLSYSARKNRPPILNYRNMITEISNAAPTFKELNDLDRCARAEITQ